MKTFRKTLTDKRLEELSDKVRRGTPISMSEAMEVVEYQEMLKKNKLPFTDRILKFFKIKKVFQRRFIRERQHKAIPRCIPTVIKKCR